jgi:ribosomal protein S18 acetylase RimI-like enzyme
MNVVKVDAADRDRVAECARLMAGSAPWITLGRTFESAVRTLQDPGKELHVVFDNGQVTAFVLLDLRGLLCGYIQSVCVLSSRRQRGLGTALIQWAEARIFRDSPDVFLCVSSFNIDAQRLYQRLGYEVVGRFADFVVPGHDELLLRKTNGPWNRFLQP